MKYGITALVLLMLVPSAYFAYSLYYQQKFKESVNTFIEKEFNEKGTTLIYKKTKYTSNPKTIELAFLSRRFTPNELQKLNKDLHDYGIENTKLIIRQDSGFNLQNIKRDILNEVKVSDTVLNEKDIHIKLLEVEIAKNTFDNKQILKEANSIFPGITSLSLANHRFYTDTDSSFTKTVLIYASKKELSNDDKEKFANWITQRLRLTGVEIHEE